MCQYRYYYYGGCQHQKTLLHSLCERAIDVAAVSGLRPSPSPSPQSLFLHDDEEGTERTNATSPPSPPPQSPTASFRSPYSNSSVPTSLTSLTSLPEPGPHATSIIQHTSELRHPSNLSPSRTTEHSMSTLSAFAPANIRDLLTGKSKQAVAVTQVKPIPSHDVSNLKDGYRKPVGHPQHEQQSGTKLRSDGSWELLTATEYFENDSTGTCKGSYPTKSGNDLQYPASNEKPDSLDSISEDIRTLHYEIEQLRKEEFEMQKKMGKSPYAGKQKMTSIPVSIQGCGSVPSKTPAPLQPSQKSASTIPQRARENKHPERPASRDGKTSSKASHGGKGSCKPSVANLAIRAKTTPERAPLQVGHGEHATENSPTSSPRDGLPGGSPHFARPTFAATIRHECVCRDSTCQNGVTTTEGSRRKATRTAVSNNHKRSSLPGGWISSSSPHSAEPSDPQSETVTSAANKFDTERRTEGEGHLDASTTEQSLRKKTSTSYMSPTKATTLRNIATLGQETIKMISPRTSRSRPSPNFQTTLPPASGLMAAGSVVSDSDSEKIITEMQPRRSPTRIAFVNPTQRAEYASPRVKSPAGIVPSELRRRMTVGVSIADVLAQHAQSSAFSSIGHATRKRRESTGDLLSPIMARLYKVGLLKSTMQPPVSGPPCTAIQSPQQEPPTALEITEPVRPVVENRQAFEPPHRRIRAAKAAEEEVAAFAATQVGSCDKSVSSSGLRATAAEFMPMFKSSMSAPAPVTPLNIIHDWDTALAVRSDEQWACLSPDDKRLIKAARSFQANGGQVPGGTLAQQAYWQTTMKPRLEMQPASLISYADVYGTDVMAGQKLEPHPVPGTRGIQSTDSGDTPIYSDGDSPSPSPRSHSTSRGLPLSPSDAWTIGADASNQTTFGWTGGAVREIKFVGYGPDAERCLNTPVNFSFRGGNSTRNRNEFGPRMIGAEIYDGYPERPLAPRSRAQWAKLKGCTKQPCSDINITHAVELLPVPGNRPLAGYCNECAYSSH